MVQKSCHKRTENTEKNLTLPSLVVRDDIKTTESNLSVPSVNSVAILLSSPKASKVIDILHPSGTNAKKKCDGGGQNGRAGKTLLAVMALID